MSGAGNITIARVRQMTDHVDPYVQMPPSELMRAAGAYLTKDETMWPFPGEPFAPKDDIRDNLALAGAYLAAAIDSINEDARRKRVGDVLNGTS